MKRITPFKGLKDMPCFMVATYCALFDLDVNFGRDFYSIIGTVEMPEGIKDNGYVSLETASKHIKKNFNVIKRVDYKKSERPKLKDLEIDGKAIMYVNDNFIYVYRGVYWSFIDNNDDDVATVWYLLD